MSTEVKQSALKTCLEESDNPRMQKYVKILDTPNITAMEWIHRTQEEFMDGIVYLEKLKNVFTVNMLELDAAARIVAERRAAQEAETGGDTEEAEDVEEININITVPMPEEKAPTPTPATTPAPKKRATKAKPKATAETSSATDTPAEKEKKPVKKRKTKAEKEEKA